MDVIHRQWETRERYRIEALQVRIWRKIGRLVDRVNNEKAREKQERKGLC